MESSLLNLSMSRTSQEPLKCEEEGLGLCINNNSIKDDRLTSLSDKTSQFADLTMAALELVNRSSAVETQEEQPQHQLLDSSIGAHPPTTDVERENIQVIFPKDSLPLPPPVFFGDGNASMLMPSRAPPVQMERITCDLRGDTEAPHSLATLVNVKLPDNAPPDERRQESTPPFLTPTHDDMTSPMISGYIPERQMPSCGPSPTAGGAYREDSQAEEKYVDKEGLENSPTSGRSPRKKRSRSTDLKTPSKPGRKRKYRPEGDGEEVKVKDGASKREVLNKPPAHVLPPCKVCAIQATGFHYGVNTCEACKGFFRRSIIRKTPYVCAKNSVKCTIAPGKRNTCPACRYQKCLQAGMSVEGIKIGRYTYAKRTQDILELQTDCPEADPDDVTSDPGEPPRLRMSEDELHRLIHSVVSANESKYPESLKSMDHVERIQNQIKEQYANGAGPSVTTKVPMEEFLSVLSTTGVQLDDRFQILQQWIGLLNDGLRYVITFAKDLPGFRDLNMNDQMALIKHSICEVWLVSRHKAFHEDFDLFTTRTGMTLDVIKALGENLGASVVRAARRLRGLGLTAEETILLKAIVIFFTDRCELEETSKIAVIQDRLLECLLYLLEQRGVNMSRTIGRISSILTDLRHITDCYQDYTHKLRIISSSTGAVEFPPLFLEVITFT